MSTPYKICAVPDCGNTTISAPGKLYFHVPKDPGIRLKWLKAAARDPTKTSRNSVIFFCEDHFDVKEDTDNYMQYTIMRKQGVKVRLRLKKGVAPHKFKCQDLNWPSKINRVYSIKREQLALAKEIVSKAAKNVSNTAHQSDISGAIPTEKKRQNYVTEASTVLIQDHDYLPSDTQYHIKGKVSQERKKLGCTPRKIRQKEVKEHTRKKTGRLLKTVRHKFAEEYLEDSPLVLASSVRVPVEFEGDQNAAGDKLVEVIKLINEASTFYCTSFLHKLLDNHKLSS